jgi:hypothetical protein
MDVDHPKWVKTHQVRVDFPRKAGDQAEVSRDPLVATELEKGRSSGDMNDRNSMPCCDHCDVFVPDRERYPSVGPRLANLPRQDQAANRDTRKEENLERDRRLAAVVSPECQFPLADRL